MLRTHYWIKIILLAAAVFIAEQAASRLALIGDNNPIAGAGVGFIALMLFGLELWPGVLLGSLATSVLARMPLEITILAALADSVVIACVYAVQRVAKFYNVTEREHIEKTLHANENSAEQFQGQLKVLHEVSNELTKAGTVDKLALMAVELGRSRLGFDRLGIWFFDEHDPSYTLGAYGTDALGNTRDERHRRVPVTEAPMIEETIRTHRLIHQNTSIEIVEPTGTKIGWNLIAVLSDGDKNVGWISADNYLSLKPLKPFQVELLRLYGLTIGHLCTRYRAEEALRKSEEEARQFQEQLKTLHQVSLELSRAQSFDDLCRMAIELGRSQLGFDRLGLWLFDAETRIMTGSFGTDTVGETLDERGVSWKVADGDEYDPLQMQELLSGRLAIAVYDNVALNDAQGQVAGHGWMVIGALRDGPRIIGTLAADNLLGHRPLSKYQIELLQLYSAAVGHLCVKKRAEAQLIELGVERGRVHILTEFIRDASHEFRTPLSIVYTKLYLLEKNADPARMVEHLHGIQEQADTIFRLVESLVLMSQLDSSVDFSFSPVSIRQILQGIVAQIRPVMETKKLDITLDIPDETLQLQADVEKIYRALYNLVENAVRFTFEGSIQIVARVEPNDMLCIRIHDSGIGINELDLPHIFKRFYRVDKAHSTRGLGLGLPISRKIIEQHGGTIQAESRPEGGTTITVSLPIYRAT